MDIGKRLRQARLEAGLSQRQLCGDTITRNMLSQIENGSARPSMATLEALASRLGKPISFFLEEQAVTSPNQAVIDAARRAWQQEDFDRVLRELSDYRRPDPVFDQEMALLLALANLRLAEEAMKEARFPYAQVLLDRAGQAGGKTAYYTPELERRRRLLLARLDPARAEDLPSDDEALLLRAKAALDGGDPERSAQYLEAAQDRQSPDWNLLRGETYLAVRAYAQAAACFHRAETAYPKQTAPRLEQCYRELEDYKRAYEYACKQRADAPPV